MHFGPHILDYSDRLRKTNDLCNCTNEKCKYSNSWTKRKIPMTPPDVFGSTFFFFGAFFSHQFFATLQGGFFCVACLAISLHLNPFSVPNSFFPLFSVTNMAIVTFHTYISCSFPKPVANIYLLECFNKTFMLANVPRALSFLAST